ncbi:SN-glycerol-3-phosphate transport system permease [Klebsiella pneumoniae]|uniref:SN-glycerol-3-phosphate transport system permease n=1 Tax=Klebsiella pneumoniae TaxID=573 RepID=A0A377XJU8_KLEPN|nr:SN-glycerol-3-phosphate transport system permease [Klebsiella pneumoniae]
MQLLTITTAGYVFACHEFRGKQTLFLLFLVQLMIMPVVMMVPNMLTLKTFGLLNTITGVMMPYFHLGVRRVPDASGVPRHSERAGGGGADGGLPLVAGAVPRAAADILAVGAGLRHRQHYLHWNEYLWPLMMLNDPDKQVLTVGLVSFAMGAESGGQWGTIGAGTLMVCLPLMLAFILFQKQFLRSFGFSGIK